MERMNKGREGEKEGEGELDNFLSAPHQTTKFSESS